MTFVICVVFAAVAVAVVVAVAVAGGLYVTLCAYDGVFVAWPQAGHSHDLPHPSFPGAPTQLFVPPAPWSGASRSCRRSSPSCRPRKDDMEDLAATEHAERDGDGREEDGDVDGGPFGH